MSGLMLVIVQNVMTFAKNLLCNSESVKTLIDNIFHPLLQSISEHTLK